MGECLRLLAEKEHISVLVYIRCGGIYLSFQSRLWWVENYISKYEFSDIDFMKMMDELDYYYLENISFIDIEKLLV